MLSHLFIKDIDECSLANGGCDHTCVNEPGTFYCECRQGFKIDEDGKNCSGFICLSIMKILF